MLTKIDVKMVPEDTQRVAEIEQNLHGFVQLGKFSVKQVIRFAAIALAESERDLIKARSDANLFRRQLIRERRKHIAGK